MTGVEGRALAGRRKLRLDVQMLTAAAISLVVIGLAYVDVPWIGPAVGLIGVFVVPGWLVTNILFGRRSGPDPETRFILVFGLGAAIVALELVTMTATGIAISRQSVLLTGAATSLLFLGILILRFRADRSDAGGVPAPSTLLLCSMAVLLLYGFVALHQPSAKESYTEFYVVPRVAGATDGQVSGADLVLFSHEQGEQGYSVVCTDTAGQERTLLHSTLEPEANVVVPLSVPLPQPGSKDKIRLDLYREREEVPYRWVELVGAGCDLLP